MLKWKKPRLGFIALFHFLSLGISGAVSPPPKDTSVSVLCSKGFTAARSCREWCWEGGWLGDGCILVAVGSERGWNRSPCRCRCRCPARRPWPSARIAPWGLCLERSKSWPTLGGGVWACVCPAFVLWTPICCSEYQGYVKPRVKTIWAAAYELIVP